MVANKLPPYDRLLADVRRLTHLNSEDGKCFTFGSTMKIVYAYLITFQENKKRRNYPAPIYPNMVDIAWECGITKPTAQKAINDLVAAGVVEIKQIQVTSGFKSNAYIVLKQEEVFSRGVTPPKPIKGKGKKSQEKQGNDNGHEEATEPQAESANQPADTPTGQSAGVAPEPAPVVAGQRDSVAPDSGSDGNHEMKQEEQPQQEYKIFENDRPFPPKKTEPEDIPEGSTRPVEIADGEQVEGELLGHDEICEKPGMADSTMLQ